MKDRMGAPVGARRPDVRKIRCVVWAFFSWGGARLGREVVPLETAVVHDTVSSGRRHRTSVPPSAAGSTSRWAPMR